MPAAIPTTEPTRLTAGDTWRWTKAVAEYSAVDGWVLSYVVTGPSTIKFSATADGTGWAVTVAVAVTTKLPGGTYRWASYVTLAGERFQVGSGTLLVAANLGALGADISTASFAVRALAIVEAALEQRLPAGLEEYEIAGKSVKHMALTELLTARTRLRHEVASERTGGKMATLEAAFVAPR